MNLNEMMIRHNFITKIVFKSGENEMSKELKVKIMEIRIEMGKLRKQFEADSKEVAEGLMTEDYRNLAQKTDKTDKEKEELEDLTKKLNESYQMYLSKKGLEEVVGKHLNDTFTEDEYSEIVSTNGISDVDINGTKLSGPDFLEVIYTLFVTE